VDIPLFSYRTLMQHDFRAEWSLSLLEVIPEIHAVLAAWPRRELAGRLERFFELNTVELQRVGLAFRCAPSVAVGFFTKPRVTSVLWGLDSKLRKELQGNLGHWMTLHLAMLWDHSTIKRKQDYDIIQEVVMDSVHAARDLIETENPAFLPRYNELLRATIEYLSD